MTENLRSNTIYILKYIGLEDSGVVHVFDSEETAQDYLSHVPEYDRRCYTITPRNVISSSTWKTMTITRFHVDPQTLEVSSALTKDYVVMEEDTTTLQVSSGVREEEFLKRMLIDPERNIELELLSTDPKKAAEITEWTVEQLNILRSSVTYKKNTWKIASYDEGCLQRLLDAIAP